MGARRLPQRDYTPVRLFRADDPSVSKAVRNAATCRIWTPGPVEEYRESGLLRFRSNLNAITYAAGSQASGTDASLGLGGTSVSATWGATTGTNSLLVMVLGWTSSPGTLTIPSPFSGNAVTGSPWNNGTNTYLAQYVVAGAAPQSGSVSVSWTSAAACSAMSLYEFTGLATSSAQDGSSVSTTGSGTAIASSSFSPGTASDLVICPICSANITTTTTSTLTVPTPAGFSIVGVATTSQGIAPKGNVVIGLMYSIAPGASAITPGCTNGHNEAWVMVVNAWLAVASGTLFRQANLATGSGGQVFVNPVG